MDATLHPFIHIGPLTLGTYGLLVASGLLCALLVLRADLRRRCLDADPHTIIGLTGLAGLAGSKIWHALESPAELFAHPFTELFSPLGFAFYGAFVGGFVALFLLARHYRMPLAEMMDVASPAAALVYGIGRIGCLISGDGDYGIPTSLPWGMGFPNGIVPTSPGVRVHPTPIYETLAAFAISYYLWRLGAKSLRGPRPTGEVFGNYLLLSGLARFLVEFIRLNPRSVFGLTNAQAASLVSIVAGAVLLVSGKLRFRALKPERRILEHAARRGDVLQKEYHRPTPECPHPERWRMFDSMTVEVEVLEFLKCLVTTVKPQLVVETGTFRGLSTLSIAEGLKQNGFGRVVTCESDPAAFASAKERMEASGLARWIECRNESSLETRIEGAIDLLFCDSDAPLREQEVRHFLPQVSPHGVILMHDASSHLKVVREAALRLEKEGLISVVLLPTPRGLVVAQKRQGRA